VEAGLMKKIILTVEAVLLN